VVAPTYGEFADADAIERIVAAAEELGFDSLWVGDHVVLPDYAAESLPPRWFEALTTVVHGLARTKRLRFGTDVLVAPYRNPVLLAKMVATAIELSGDRIELGLAAGYMKGEFEALGLDFSRRGAITEEYVEVLRLLFETDGPVSHAGREISLDRVHFGPRPSSPPPILLGGNAPAAAARAARAGDGWHPLYPSFEDYASLRSAMSAQRGEEGRVGPYLWSYSCPLCEIRPDDASSGTSARANDIDGYLPDLPTAPSGRLRFRGRAADLREDFTDLATIGVQQAVLRFWIPGSPVDAARYVEQMTAFAVEVMPAITPREPHADTMASR
jgi:probable F420-dependent oxidoreductase